jgi:hypothetical protein
MLIFIGLGIFQTSSKFMGKYWDLTDLFTVRIITKLREILPEIKPYPTAFPYGNVMVLHFYKQQESSTTKTVHKVINKGLKAYV